jgi:hypothetical protein
MAFTVTKNPDGDVSFGSWNGELVTLQPSPSDYPPGGYALVDGVSVVDNPNLSANIDLYRLLVVVPAGGELGYVPSFNSSTKKLAMYQQSAATGQLTQVPNGTDLSALSFQLLLLGL